MNEFIDFIGFINQPLLTRVRTLHIQYVLFYRTVQAASPLSGRDAGCDTFDYQGLPVFIAFITFIGSFHNLYRHHDDILSLGQSLIENFGTSMVADHASL